MIGLIDDHDLEALTGRLINLLGLRDLLQKVLDDHSIIIPHIRRRNFKMIYGSNDIEFEFAVGCCLENSGIDLDFFDTWPIELLKRCDNSSLLTCARRPVDE